MYSVAIVGRPNVGKSTLFNRLTGKRLALVDDQPGVTRDRREGTARLFDLSFRIIDTAGLEEAFDNSLEARMRRQTERAVADADVTIMVVDARTGITPMDEHFARWLRKKKSPIVLMVNKCEGREADMNLLEAYSLGLGGPVPYSAEHGLGASDLYHILRKRFVAMDERRAAQKAGVREAVEAIAVKEAVGEAPEDSVPEDPAGKVTSFEDDAGDDFTDEQLDLEREDVARLADLSLQLDEEGEFAGEGPQGPLQLAIVGRPNVGKSTLINRLVGEDRLLTGPEAGITRDAISVEWSWRGQAIRLIDTAGMRKRSRVLDPVEKLSVADSLRALKFAQVAILMLDADGILDRQDLTIARTVLNEGRALVIAVNKWDSCRDKKAVLQRLSDRLQTSLPQGKGTPVITTSGLKGTNLDGLLQAVFDIHDIWNIRITTSRLNDWLQETLDIHPPPAPGGRRIKLKFITQARTRPPTFAISCSLPEDLPGSYVRFIENSLRETFDLPGVPLRINLKKSFNPYGGRKKRRA